MPIRKAELKQKIVATLVVVFMLAMVSGMVKVSRTSAEADDATLELIVSAGSLAIEAASQYNFAGVTLNAVTVNTTANMIQVNMRDARGSGAGWAATGSANNLTAANSSEISNIWLRWAPGDIYALDGASNDGVAAGPDYSGNFGDGARNLTGASSGNGMGNYVINGTLLNLTVDSSTPATTYHNTLTLTIS
ncbi:MAG: hypothetical protein A2359_01705 [Candidatus Moranbacteria bacterium RIFOXYB1_FULL_43_19]|nr:MAG: hypothetical protein A2359_01705 [Candidatus Moranbacteria bacterium RIFOXYB1_FULL_43_19]OGI27963.1 MAG: hypothetical protein A2184_02590 [Candidatus Moranbacteria bacterium RIFOXYA1_FULL_44_7]OGI32614.1 MAG: hypothetical protein A2420_01275 [Candidatus Moranbacteria bacterium RIFOXYC1_FULL_44_13]OGI37847.1 MAG: hypothetical protein A2612_05495 [Candidatus Moranbacteria bacterium RIFOXYD1_FULL_44_12]